MTMNRKIRISDIAIIGKLLHNLNAVFNCCSNSLAGNWQPDLVEYISERGLIKELGLDSNTDILSYCRKLGIPHTTNLCYTYKKVLPWINDIRQVIDHLSFKINHPVNHALLTHWKDNRYFYQNKDLNLIANLSHCDTYVTIDNSIRKCFIGYTDYDVRRSMKEGYFTTQDVFEPEVLSYCSALANRFRIDKSLLLSAEGTLTGPKKLVEKWTKLIDNFPSPPCDNSMSVI